MSLSDPVADMLVRVKNAQKAEHPDVSVPYSRLKSEIARILKNEGYISETIIEGEGVRKTIRLSLKYTADNRPVITGLRRESKCGLRRYARADALPKVLRGLGVAIVSTSKGIMTAREAAVSKLGGEVLCSVW